MKKLKKVLRRISGTTLVIALLTFALGWEVGTQGVQLQWNSFQPSIHFSNQTPPSSVSNIDFSLFWNVWNQVTNDYYDKKAIDPQKMYYGAIQGMVAAIGDPYTVFLPPDSQKSIQEQLGGSFEGVGMQLEYNKNNQIVVSAPLKDTPADKAGIQAGDIILKINNKDTTNMSLPDAVAIIRGPKGSQVSFSILHDGSSTPRNVTLTRDTIVVKSVQYTLKTTTSGKKIGYIQLTQFGERTDSEWNDAVSQALADGVQGVILDLRNNPGGYMDDAIYIGSEFLPQGDNVVLQDDGQGNRTNYPVNRQGKLLDLPLYVLINKGSASASEIVSGALQDYKRAKLVGEQSFGKGTIQESEDLPGGTGLHITKAKWLTPTGRWIHTVGLTPDVPVTWTIDPNNPDTMKTDPQLNKVLELLN